MTLQWDVSKTFLRRHLWHNQNMTVQRRNITTWPGRHYMTSDMTKIWPSSDVILRRHYAIIIWRQQETSVRRLYDVFFDLTKIRPSSDVILPRRQNVIIWRLTWPKYYHLATQWATSSGRHYMTSQRDVGKTSLWRNLWHDQNTTVLRRNITTSPDRNLYDVAKRRRSNVVTTSTLTRPGCNVQATS